MIARINNLTKSYANKEVFYNISFSIMKNKKIGLLGNNGVGKTSLMNCISGMDKEFNGSIEFKSGSSIAYLHQSLYLNPDRTLAEECLLHFDPVIDLRNKVKDIELNIHKDSSLHKTYGDMLHLIEAEDGYNIENKVEKVLSGLGFSKDQMNQKISTMSGGEQRRGLLGKILLSEANLLLLDEPTNHLDIFAIKWLESFLKGYKGAILMVSHDVNLLDGLVDEIIEIENNGICSYGGNYQFYLKEKIKNSESLKKAYDLQQKQIKKENDFIRINIAGQKTKQAQSRRKKLDKIDRITYINKQKEWSFHFSNDVMHHRNILELNNLSKNYGNKTIFNNLSLKVEKGDRIGLIGQNGCGKTSLINTILDGNNKAVKLNTNIRIAYFSQGGLNLNMDLSVLDNIQNSKITETEARSYLGLFQFSGDNVFKPVNVLSGGEKTRLAILKIILMPCDLLILDEPTNHLDIVTRGILSRALKDYKGTILAVSHDRGFIDHFANRIVLIASQKAYSFYGRYSENEKEILKLIREPLNNNKAYPKEETKTKKKNINIYKIDRIEKIIDELEQKKNKLTSLLTDPSIYSNYLKLTEIQKELDEINTLLKNRYSEWEKLHN